MSSRIRAKKLARTLAIAAAVILGGSRCAGAAKGFIDFLISKIGWEGTSCLINVLVFKVPCSKPERPLCPSGCFLGKPQDNGDGTCTWIADLNGVLCGKTAPYPGQPPPATTCQVCVPIGTALIGYDALPPVTTTPNVASITPTPGKLLDPKQNIVIKFKQTMDATSVVLSSDVAGEAAPYAFSRSTDQFLFNDTLTVAPLAAWTAGHRALTVDVKDDSGNPANVKASWFVLAPGQAASPDFSTCTTGCAQRWFLPYVVQFEASGGFPPYVWSISSGIAPPYDSELFAATGTFAGGPAFCVCERDFTVCVTDQAQSQTCHPVHWGFGL
jgi:hypothetical protein